MKCYQVLILCMMWTIILLGGEVVDFRYQRHGPFSYDCWNVVLEYLPFDSSYFYYSVCNRDITEHCASRIVLDFIDFCRKLAAHKNKDLVYKKMRHISRFYNTTTPYTATLLLKYFKEYGNRLMSHILISHICVQQLAVLEQPRQCAVLYMFVLCKPIVHRAYPHEFWLLLPYKVRASDVHDRILDSVETACCTPFGHTIVRNCCPTVCLQETLLSSCLACLLWPFLCFN